MYRVTVTRHFEDRGAAVRWQRSAGRGAVSATLEQSPVRFTRCRALTPAEVGRSWPTVLEAVKRRSRVTWMVLQDATAELRGGVLWLTPATRQHAAALYRQDHDMRLSDALLEVFGVRLIVLVGWPG